MVDESGGRVAQDQATEPQRPIGPAHLIRSDAEAVEIAHGLAELFVRKAPMPRLSRSTSPARAVRWRTTISIVSGATRTRPDPMRWKFHTIGNDAPNGVNPLRHSWI